MTRANDPGWRSAGRLLWVASVLAAATSLAGCVAIRADETPRVAWPPTAPTARRSVSLSLESGAVTGLPSDVMAPLLRMWREQAIAVYRDSGLFSDIRTGFSEADLAVGVRVLGHVRAGANSQILGLLSGLTLTLIPLGNTSRIVITTEFRGPDGQVLGVIEKSDTVVVWTQLFLLFGMPFANPASVEKALIIDLHRAILAEAVTRRIL